MPIQKSAKLPAFPSWAPGPDQSGKPRGRAWFRPTRRPSPAQNIHGVWPSARSQGCCGPQGIQVLATVPRKLMSLGIFLMAIQHQSTRVQPADALMGQGLSLLTGLSLILVFTGSPVALACRPVLPRCPESRLCAACCWWPHALQFKGLCDLTLIFFSAFRPHPHNWDSPVWGTTGAA